jgi:alkylation response protein AidB-like acyl-CoA dehydrogenase
MDTYPWWSAAQKKLAEDVKKAMDETLIPVAEKAAWQKLYPWEAVKIMGELGWFGALIPSIYGGSAEAWGVTGACIILEEAGRGGELCMTLGPTMYGGTHQLIHEGTKEQKLHWLPDIAKGKKLAAIVMTEPFAGSDAAAIETTATREGDYYSINGKKRFQTNIAAASIYLTYVRTSDNPADIEKHRHLTALVIDKGTPGFTVERINDLMAYDGCYNGYLSFDNCKVPVANRLNKEGTGWNVMTSGLNIERVLNAAPMLGIAREAIRYAMMHMNRRVQFNAPIGDIGINQFKVADMLWKLKVAKLITYYSAYCCDLGLDIPVEAATSKMFATDAGLATCIDAIQVMGGNGTTRSYPVERMMRDCKVDQIAAGTNEILKRLIYRMGTRELTDDLKAPIRVIDPELKVPMPLGKPLAKKRVNGENDVLALLAENYLINPGLHLTMEDIKEQLDTTDEYLKKYLLVLEKRKLAGLYYDKHGNLAMARITFKGLSETHPAEYYRHIPPWIGSQDLF